MRTPQDREQFVRVWQAATSVDGVATALGMTTMAARARAYRLRRGGTWLKHFKPGPAPANAVALDNRGYNEAFIRIVNLLGPNRYGCGENACAECRFEREEALLTARRALGIPDGRVLDARNWHKRL